MLHPPVFRLECSHTSILHSILFLGRMYLEDRPNKTLSYCTSRYTQLLTTENILLEGIIVSPNSGKVVSPIFQLPTLPLPVSVYQLSGFVPLPPPFSRLLPPFSISLTQNVVCHSLQRCCRVLPALCALLKVPVSAFFCVSTFWQ